MRYWLLSLLKRVGLMKAQGHITITRARKGDTGAVGISYRVSYWQSGKEYRNDLLNTTASERFIDICVNMPISMIGDSNFKAYQCVVTHTSSSSVPLGTSGYWTAVNNLKPLVSPLILANKIVADYIDVDTLYVKHLNGADGTFTGNLSAAGGTFKGTLTVYNASNAVVARIGDSALYSNVLYPFYIGGTTPNNAVTKIDSTGKITTTNIVANGGKIGNFSIDDGLWLTAKGNNYSMGFSAAAFDLECSNDAISPGYFNGSSYLEYNTVQNSLFYVCGYETAYYSSARRVVASIKAAVTNPNKYPLRFRTVGIEIEASGATPYSQVPQYGYTRYGNFSIVATAGKMLGWRPEIRALSAGGTLYAADCVVVVTGDGTIYFPSTPEDGQTYFIFMLDKYSVTLNFNGKNCFRTTEGTKTTQSHSSFVGLDIITYSAIRNEWEMISMDSN